MQRDQLSETLFNNMNIVEPYPDKVVPIDQMIDITAFFPGGTGLWCEEHSDVFPSVLVLGQDFSTDVAYQEMLADERTDLDCPTWKNLIKLFKEAGIRLTDCFFSNVFMGLRVSESMIGDFPGLKDKDFVDRNMEFLTYQIGIIKPKMIITLGKFAAELLSNVSDSGLDSWKNYNALRVANNGFKVDVHFDSHPCTCVALEHTSMRNSNVKRRRYENIHGEYKGNDAEIEMLKDALKSTGR